MRLHDDGPRGSGRTYNQLKNAKPSALFICATRYNIKYIMDILVSLERDDIYVLSYDDIFPYGGHMQAGMTFSEVILDHSILLNQGHEHETMNYLKSLCRTPNIE